MPLLALSLREALARGAGRFWLRTVFVVGSVPCRTMLGAGRGAQHKPRARRFAPRPGTGLFLVSL